MSEVALSITDVSKSYSGIKVVDNLNLELEPGEIFGLLGPNGAGKSTTINMTTGVTSIDQGKISIFGLDNQKDYRQTRHLTGVMHQEFVNEPFFKIGIGLKMHSGYYGVKDNPKWRNELIDRLALRPHLQKKFITLSGGMKRRFMVAKALLHQPRLLILDEPTAGVDVELRRSLWDFMREINDSGTTILLTTHYLEEAEKMCGRIAIMNHGEIVTLEKTSDLLRKVGDQKLILKLTKALDTIPETFQSFHPNLSENKRSITFSINRGSDITEIVRVAHDIDLEIDEVDTCRPDLEDIFIRLTGGVA